MPIEFRNDIAGHISGPIATGYGASQKAERDRTYAQQVQEANARLALQHQQMQLQALDSYRGDQLKYLSLAVQNDQYGRGQAQQRYQFDQTQQRQGSQFDAQQAQQMELHRMQDQRTREMEAMQDARQREMQQAGFGAQFELDQRRTDAQRERDLMQIRNDRGMPPVQWSQHDQQEMARLQAAQRDIASNPSYSQQDRMQANAMIQQRLAPLQQRQQQAQEFSRENEEREVRRQFQMRTQTLRNPYTGVSEQFYIDPSGRPHQLFNAPSGTSQNGLAPISSADLRSIEDDIAADPRNDNLPAAQRAQMVQEQALRQQLIRAGRYGQDPVTPQLAQILGRLPSNTTRSSGDAPGTASRVTLSETQNTVNRIQEISALTEGFRTIGRHPHLQRDLAAQMNNLQQLDPRVWRDVSGVNIGGQGQGQPQQGQPQPQAPQQQAPQQPQQGQPQPQAPQQQAPQQQQPGAMRPSAPPDVAAEIENRISQEISETVRRNPTVGSMRFASGSAEATTSAREVIRMAEQAGGRINPGSMSAEQRRSFDQHMERIGRVAPQMANEIRRLFVGSSQQAASPTATIDQAMQQSGDSGMARIIQAIATEAERRGGRIDPESLTPADRQGLRQNIETLRRLDPQAAAAVESRYLGAAPQGGVDRLQRPGASQQPQPQPGQPTQAQPQQPPSGGQSSAEAGGSYRYQVVQPRNPSEFSTYTEMMEDQFRLMDRGQRSMPIQGQRTPARASPPEILENQPPTPRNREAWEMVRDIWDLRMRWRPNQQEVTRETISSMTRAVDQRLAALRRIDPALADYTLRWIMESQLNPEWREHIYLMAVPPDPNLPAPR